MRTQSFAKLAIVHDIRTGGQGGINLFFNYKSGSRHGGDETSEQSNLKEMRAASVN